MMVKYLNKTFLIHIVLKMNDFQRVFGLWVSLHIEHHHCVEITIVFFGVN
jgi:hypothetical protein